MRLKRVIIYPNSDRGHRGVLRAIEQHARQHPVNTVRVFRSLPRDEYLRTLISADVLIGNSSSGIIEAPFAGTPAVNIGQRQAGREVGGPAVVHAAESLGAIRAALRTATRRRPRRGGDGVYGDGTAGRRISDILAGLHWSPELLRKQISY